LLLSGAALLGGCGLDLGRIYVQMKKSGGWKQFVQKLSGSGYSLSGRSLGQEIPLQDNQQKIVDIIRSSYGDAAAKETENEFLVENAELYDLSHAARDDKDFAARQQAIIDRHAAGIKAISLRYRGD